MKALYWASLICIHEVLTDQQNRGNVTMFRTNESRSDRIIRIIFGLIALGLAFNHVGGNVGTWVFGIVAALAIITGITGVCALYKLIGVSTCPIRK